MGFAKDYYDYEQWKQSWDDSPEAWERQVALKADADEYRTNKDDIEEALDMLYQARQWWSDPNTTATNENVGRWFIQVFGDQLGEWCFTGIDDEPPF